MNTYWAQNLLNSHALVAAGWKFEQLESGDETFLRYEAAQHKQVYGILRLYDPGGAHGEILARVERLVGGGTVPGSYSEPHDVIRYLRARGRLAAAGGASQRLKGFSF